MNESKQLLPEAEQANDSPEMGKEFEALLLYLKQSRGFDFTAWAPVAPSWPVPVSTTATAREPKLPAMDSNRRSAAGRTKWTGGR